MEILINAHRAGFAQGFSKLSCRKRLGKHMLAREVLTVTWWVLCSALAHELTFPSAFFPSLCLLSIPLLGHTISVDRVPPECLSWAGVLVTTSGGLPLQMP